jgi:hypothetical protein
MSHEAALSSMARGRWVRLRFAAFHTALILAAARPIEGEGEWRRCDVRAGVRQISILALGGSC